MSAQLLFAIVSYPLTLVALAFVIIIFFTIITNLLVRVPFVPTRKHIIKHIAKLAKIKKNDKVYDLGCGDGRFLTEAQKYTNKAATGFEQAALPYLLAQLRKYLSKTKIKLRMTNFLKANLSDADIIYCYLGPEVMPKIGDKVKKECRKGTQIFSHTFSIKNMEPVKVWQKDKQNKLPRIFLYEV